MITILDEILSSDKVVEEFYKNYLNEDFRMSLLSVLPEVEECRNLNQDNPWHIYNCLDHILHSVEEINKQTINMNSKTRRLLSYAMFYHDLGKSSTHIRRFSKLYKREIDSFFNHNIKGVEIAKRTLSEFGFNNKEKELISLLIKEHDMFMFLTLKSEDKYHRLLTDTYLKETIEKFNQYGDGKQILEYLIMIGKADNLSQNPKMTKDSLFLIETMDKMLNNKKIK